LETIHIGLKKVAIATGYDSEDPDKIENEILIYAKDSEGMPFGTEFPEDIGKTSLELPMLARLKVHAHEGADELIFRLDLACENIGQKSMVTRQRESLIWSVCRLYDMELITGSRACELLDGIKVQEFRELHTKWAESVDVLMTRI